MTELVVAEFSDEGGSSTETRNGDGDVSRSAAGGFEEAWCFGEGDAGLGGDEVDEHLAEADDQWFVSVGCHLETRSVDRWIKSEILKNYRREII